MGKTVRFIGVYTLNPDFIDFLARLAQKRQQIQGLAVS
jgi:hypothetical protein